MMMLSFINLNHSNFSDFGESSMGKGLSHYLFKHFDSIFPSHLSSFWLLMFLGFGFRRLVSSVDYHFATELLSIGYEILSCQIDFYSFEFVKDVHFCNEIFDHKSISKNIFAHQSI